MPGLSSITALDIFPVLCCQDRFPAALTGPHILFRCQPLAIFLIVAIVTGEHPELLSSYTAKDNILPFIAKRAVTCRWMTARQTGISPINLVLLLVFIMIILMVPDGTIKGS